MRPGAEATIQADGQPGEPGRESLDEAALAGQGPGDQGPADPDQTDRYTVRSVARAMRLINIVADGPADGLSLSDLARALGASKSTTLALARTLTGTGVLRDSRPGPRYSLGTALIRLGDITRSQLPIGEICRPVLADLAAATKMTSRVAVCDDGYPVFIERVDGPGTVRFHTPLGQREVPHASAAGKAMLATMPPSGSWRSARPAGCARGRRTRSPISRRCWKTWRPPGLTVSRWTTRRTPRGSSAWARCSTVTTGPARARSASPGSRATCLPGG